MGWGGVHCYESLTSIHNNMLINKGVVVNLMPKSTIVWLGKYLKDLMPSNIVVMEFHGKMSLLEGMVILNLQVDTIIRLTLFIVMLPKAYYNLLMVWDWIHAMGAIPSTLYQKLVIWEENRTLKCVNVSKSMIALFIYNSVMPNSRFITRMCSSYMQDSLLTYSL